MKKIRKITAGVLAGALALTAAGCSRASATNASAAAGSSAVKKTIQVSIESEDAPYTYADKDGKPQGFGYEVLKKIDEKLPGYQFEYKVIDYETGLIGTKEGKYDIDAGCFFRTPSREKTYLVSSPYNYYFLNLIVKPESAIKTMSDLNGKSVAPIAETDGRYASFTDWEKAHPDVKINMTPSSAQQTFVDMFDAVHNGTYDAVYLSKAQYDGVADKLKYKLKVTDIVDGRDTVFLINKKDTALQADVNKAITELRDDGTLPKLTQQYFKQDNFAIAKKLGLK